ncbi:MAG TPA: hypothetical protein VGO58_14490 [Chitinophagaceae bacterium]|jgi:hypothetical protein|nr:hypothetical protein [Chitinophagaceae bacterium]
MINQKQFGVWMDSHHATVAGNENAETGEWSILAHITGEEITGSSSNKNENNQKDMLRGKFFKEIAHHLQNATHLHATGTGQAQEQFLHWLAASPQFKNVKTEESTSNKMSDESLVKYFSGQ